MSLTRLIHASAHELPMIEDGSINCVVTSPPYFGLRAYDGEQAIEWPSVDYAPMAGLPMLHVPPMTCPLGHEPTPEAYIAHLILCLREWRRVLHDSGVAWVNLGDSFAANRGYQVPDSKWKDVGNNHGSQVPNGLKPKDLMMIPARFALAAQADGWYLRQAIIWAKGISFCPTYAGSSMPESVRDRPSTSHEYIFLLAKRERYFFDMEAVKEGSKENSGWAKQRAKGVNTWEYLTTEERDKVAVGNNGYGSTFGTPGARNLRSVWAINPRPYSAAHFAVWPAELVTPMVKAGASEHGVCSQCYAPWERVVERSKGDAEAHARPKRTAGMDSQTSTLSLSGNGSKEWAERGSKQHTVGWQPTCQHDAPIIPATVLDPFCGSGTTLAVAAKLGRRGIGVDLAESYLDDLVPDRTTVQMELGGIA